jgi:hypothetical protein
LEVRNESALTLFEGVLAERRSMKFLVITSRRQQLAFSPDVMSEVLTMQRQWIHDRLDDGTIETIYGFPHGGGVAVVNADHGDELTSLLIGSPGYMTLDWDIRPLGDIDVVLANVIETFERVAGGAPVYG